MTRIGPDSPLFRRRTRAEQPEVLRHAGNHSGPYSDPTLLAALEAAVRSVAGEGEQ